MVREYIRRCNTVENIHEVIGDPYQEESTTSS